MPIYVYSGASGANDGTSWTDAYTSMSNAGVTGAAAGADIWAASDHVEGTAATITLNFTNGTAANPVRVTSVARADDTYAPGAVIANSTNAGADANINGGYIIQGCTLNCADILVLASTNNKPHQLIACTCTFQDLQVGTAAAYAELICEDCTFTAASGPATFCTYNGEGRIARFRNCTFATDQATANFVVISNTEGGYLIFEDCDLSDSGFSTLVSHGAGNMFDAVFRRCLLPASYTVDTGTMVPGTTITIEHCGNGTITVPVIGINQYKTYYGTVDATLSRYRTGGATDGLQANPYSWALASNANALEYVAALESPPLVRWVVPDGSISGATPQGVTQHSRAASLRATPANLTTDSGSVWNGTGVGTKQQIDFTLSNGATLTVYVASGVTLQNDEFWANVSEPDQVGGPVSVRCYLAKASTTVYVDALIGISGANTPLVWTAEGVQFGDEQASGGSGGSKGDGTGMFRHINRIG